MKAHTKYILVLMSIVLLASCGSQGTTSETNSSKTANLEINNENMVQTGSKVAVHYTGTLTDGTKFDSSLDRGTPLEFTAGTGQMIPGFDAGVMGMEVGDKKTLTLAPAQAYGEYDESRTETVTRENLASFEAAGFKLEVGEKIPTQFGTLKITSVDEENITLDLNHELAGKTLIFDVELVEIKK